MKCRLCSGKTDQIFELKILNNYIVKYYKCTICELIQTEKPYWLKESYSSAIAKADTGILQRNIILSRKLATLIFFAFDKYSKFIDYAGGYGVLTRLMRDIGFDYYWEDRYAENLFAKGFEVNKSKYQIVSAFEVLEHIEHPIVQLKEILHDYGPDAIVFSTTLYAEPVSSKWWYFTPTTGQHISIYNRKTLEYIAKELGFNLYTDGRNFHMLSKRKLNFFQRLMMTNLSIPMSLIVQLAMKSKTFSDHKDIINSKK